MYLSRYSTSGEVAAAFSAGVSVPGSTPAVSAALPSSAPAALAAGLPAEGAAAAGLPEAVVLLPAALLGFEVVLLLEPLHAARNAAVAALPPTRKRRRDAAVRRSQ